MKSSLSVVLICVTFLVGVFASLYTYSNRNRTNDVISVTGLGKKDFKSDLVTWEGTFNRQGTILKEISHTLQDDKKIVKEYLLEKGLTENEIAFMAVRIDKNYESIYDGKGDYLGRKFSGYTLVQSIKVESKDVDKVEKISRSITELIDKGVGFHSDDPQYYYTKLSELKIEMVATATEDARIRAEQIAKNANAHIGNLRYARMGVFQIIAQNSNDELTWGGTFNTNSKLKTATITMRLQFGIN